MNFSTLKNRKASTHYGRIKRAQISNKYNVCKLQIQDVASPKVLDVNFRYVDTKSQTSHVILSLLGHDIKNAEKEYFIMYCFKTQTKTMLEGPAAVFPNRRQFLHMECFRYKT